MNEFSQYRQKYRVGKTAAEENLGRHFGEFRCSYQSVFCNKLLSCQHKDVATDMLKQQKNGLHRVTCLRQQEGL